MLIEVTANDIRQGIQGAADTCPVARAIRRISGHRCHIETCDTVWLGEHLVWLPAQEVMRISTYDKTGKMGPHTFELDTNGNHNSEETVA